MKTLKTKLTAAVFIVHLFTNDTNVHAQTSISDTTFSQSDSVFSHVEVEASFPGGQQAWAKYISNTIQDNQSRLRKSDYGTCIVKFIVNTNGSVTEAEATTMQKSRLAKIAIDAIRNGPRWFPAKQNGRFVNAYRLQPIILADPGK